MSVLLISYDITASNQGGDPASVIIGEYVHIRLADGSYAIETDEKTRTVFNKLLPFLGHNVHLLVVTLVKPFAGGVIGPINAWLAKHLPEA